MFNVEELLKCVKENDYKMAANQKIQDRIENAKTALRQNNLAKTAKAWFRNASDSEVLGALRELHSHRSTSSYFTDELVLGVLLADEYISFEQAKTYIEYCFSECINRHFVDDSLVKHVMVVFLVAKYYELKDVVEVLRMFKPEILDEVMRCSLRSDYRLLGKIRGTFKYCGLDGYYHEFISSETINLLLDVTYQKMCNDFYDDSGDD